MNGKLVVLGTEQGVLKSPPCPGLQATRLSNHGARPVHPESKVQDPMDNFRNNFGEESGSAGQTVTAPRSISSRT